MDYKWITSIYDFCIIEITELRKIIGNNDYEYHNVAWIFAFGSWRSELYHLPKVFEALLIANNPKKLIRTIIH